MRDKKILIIAAVAVMLVAATSAYGYCEAWDGWFNSGYLEYLGARFDYAYGEGIVEDYTSGDIDTFAIHAIPAIGFTCLENGGTIVLRVITSTGSKPTGQEGQKYGSGNWTGTAVLTITGLPPVNFAVEGTWASTDPYHFNYDTDPDSYTASWLVTDSDPDGLGGRGGSAGKLME